MLFAHAIQQTSGLQFVADSLNIQSSVGRRALLALPFLTRAQDIENALGETDAACRLVRDESRSRALSLVSMKLMQLRDIHATLNHLANGNVLNDIELFEIKHFALLAEDIRGRVRGELHLPFIAIADVNAVIAALDPEGKRIPHFYVYDQYSPLLASLRAQIARLGNGEENEKEADDLRFQAQRVEDEIRAKLSRQLVPHAAALQRSLAEIARLDVLLAKAAQAVELGLCKPRVSDSETVFEGLFHPQIRHSLAQQGKDFQPVAVSVPPQPTLITGANMAGKSVLLKSVALAQTMAQFGFFVPAESATVAPVEKIVSCVGDAENALQGLSSFAAEMLRLNIVAENAERGVAQLVLIDELARTTNPAEGKAIVSGVLHFLSQHGIRALVTTHYAVETPCRRLRVKGFSEQKISGGVTVQNINRFMDYSLEETTENQVPHEALRIAEIIGVNKNLMEKITVFLKEDDENNSK